VTECGEIYSYSAETPGQITYKLGRSFEKNERCVWTIRFPESDRVTFNLTEEGFGPSSYAVVSVGVFSKDPVKNALLQDSILL
jgi:hypothetical protein